MRACSTSAPSIWRISTARCWNESKKDAFLLNVTGTFFALMILRQGVPIFYRAKAYTFADHADSRRATVVREVDSSLTYYRERLGGQLPAQIHLRCIDIDLNRLQEELAEREGGSVLPVDPTQVVEVGRTPLARRRRAA